MADTTRRICESCGIEDVEWKMRTFNTGIKTHYLCTDCYRKANSDVVFHEMRAKKRFKGEKQ